MRKGSCPQWKTKAESRGGRTYSKSHRGWLKENEGGSQLCSANYLSLVSGGSFWNRPEFPCSKGQISAKLQGILVRLCHVHLWCVMHAGLSGTGRMSLSTVLPTEKLSVLMGSATLLYRIGRLGQNSPKPSCLAFGFVMGGKQLPLCKILTGRILEQSALIKLGTCSGQDHIPPAFLRGYGRQRICHCV